MHSAPRVVKLEILLKMKIIMAQKKKTLTLLMFRLIGQEVNTATISEMLRIV